jgi:2-haloacid dehalogenase
LASARQMGLATGYVPRPAEFGPHQHRNLAPTAGWDVIATSITDLAGRLAPTP